MISRKGYQAFLYAEAKKLGVQVRFNNRVVTFEDLTNRPAILLADGARLEADLVVGADGEFAIIYPPMTHVWIRNTRTANI